MVARCNVGICGECVGRAIATFVFATLTWLWTFAIIIEQAPGQLGFRQQTGIFSSNEPTETVAVLCQGILEPGQDTWSGHVAFSFEHAAVAFVQIGDVQDTCNLLPSDSGLEENLFRFIPPADEGDIHHQASQLEDAIGARMFPFLHIEGKMGMLPYGNAFFCALDWFGVEKVLHDARHHILKQASRKQVLDPITKRAALEQLVEFVAQAFRGRGGHIAGIVANSLPAMGVQTESFLMLEANAAKHAHRVLTINGDGIGWCDEQAILEVSDAPSGWIEHYTRMKVFIEGIACIIAT